MNLYTVVFGTAFTVQANDPDEAIDIARADLAEEFGLENDDRFFVDFVELEQEDF